MGEFNSSLLSSCPVDGCRFKLMCNSRGVPRTPMCSKNKHFSIQKKIFFYPWRRLNGIHLFVSARISKKAEFSRVICYHMCEVIV